MDKIIKDTVKKLGKRLGKAKSLGKCCRDIRLCIGQAKEIGVILTGYNTRENEQGYEEWIVIKIEKNLKNMEGSEMYNKIIVQKLI